MRYFNTYGPVNEQDHYVVPRQALVTELIAQIERGTYFTIFAPRQMGKTTLLRALEEILAPKPDYLPLMLSFEVYESATVEDFLQSISKEVLRRVIAALQVLNDERASLLRDRQDQLVATDFVQLRDLFLTLSDLLPEKRLVFLIDEFDGTPLEAISGLLQIWRHIYLTQNPPRTIHSIALIGLQNIATLNLGRSSPFNIARQVRLHSFTLAQVTDLLGQYTTESGQPFTPEATAALYDLTAGHPFLVNRLAAIITEELATDRTQPITPVAVDRAQRKLVRETNYNFETLGRHARAHPDEILAILFGRVIPFNLNNPLVSTLYMQGIISESATESCQIANPIYRQVLIAYLRPLNFGLQGDMLANGFDFRKLVTADGLDLKAILSNFRQFVERRGKEAFKVSPMPQEATGQYMLMAYLDSVLRQIGGVVYTEVPSGDGRLDLIVVFQEQRYIIETKIWRGAAYFDRGLEQMQQYLTSEGVNEGYYVLSHARPNVYGQLDQQALEYTQTIAQTNIHIYLVRLGPIFEESL